MKKFYQILAAIVVAICILHSSAKGQSISPVPVVQLEASWLCAGQDKLWYSESNSGTINEVCVDPTSARQKTHVLAYVQAVQRIVPLGPSSFYVFTWTGRIYKYSSTPNGSSSLYVWRGLSGDGVPDPGSIQGDSIKIRYTADREVVQFFLSPGAFSANPQPVFDSPNWDPRLSYAKVFRTRQGFEAWLNPGNNLFVPRANSLGLGLDLFNGPYLFDGQSPIDAVGVGESVYAVLATQYDCPNTPTGFCSSTCKVKPGKLARVTLTAGAPKVENLVDAFIDSNYSQSVIAAGIQGVYYIEAWENGQSRNVTVYNPVFRSSKVVILGQKEPQLYFSAIAIAPSLFPTLPSLPAPPSR